MIACLQEAKVAAERPPERTKGVVLEGVVANLGAPQNRGSPKCREAGGPCLGSASRSPGDPLPPVPTEPGPLPAKAGGRERRSGAQVLDGAAPGDCGGRGAPEGRLHRRLPPGPAALREACGQPELPARQGSGPHKLGTPQPKRVFSMDPGRSCLSRGIEFLEARHQYQWLIVGSPRARRKLSWTWRSRPGVGVASMACVPGMLFNAFSTANTVLEARPETA